MSSSEPLQVTQAFLSQAQSAMNSAYGALAGTDTGQTTVIWTDPDLQSVYTSHGLVCQENFAAPVDAAMKARSEAIQTIQAAIQAINSQLAAANAAYTNVDDEAGADIKQVGSEMGGASS